MSFEIRPITAEEVPAFGVVEAMGFGQDYKPEADARFLALMPLERTVAAFDGHELVGTLGDFPMELTVPGGAQVGMAGTTMVSVQATHTRQGILRSMITRHLDNAVERGEPVAGLWASEAGIYGRFGFGLATECHDVQIDSRHITTPIVADDIQLAMVPATQIPDVVVPYWHKIAGERAGFVGRSEARWQDIMNDPEDRRDGATSSRHVVARRGGQVVGYMEYRQQSKWEHFVSNGNLVMSTLVASDYDAHMSLWAYALDVDLFPNVLFWNGAVDDPLAYMSRESRAVKKVVVDALYVRIVDIAAALTGRTYERDGSVTFAVVDDMDYIAGTYRLTVSNGTGSLEETTAAADVTLGARELGALYLGRVCADLFISTGAIVGEPAAMRTMGQLFATSRAPWCPEMF